MINVNEYFRYAIKAELLTNLKFYYTVMTIPLQNSNEYFKIDNKRYFVKLDKGYEEVSGKTTDEPLLAIGDPITLFNADLPNIETSVDTTVGKAIINYVTLVYNFKGKIPYVNKNMISCSTLEDLVCDALKKDVVTVQEYINFVDSCSMLQALSRITTVSATEKTMTPPPGIIEFKNNLIKKYDKLYGKSWVKDMVRVIEFQDELKKVDDEYMADDPTNGIITSGKVKNNARVKQYLSFGTDAGFSEGSDITPDLVFNSLLEGYPADIKQLTTIYNSSRAGSFSRGNETKNGGVAAKNLLRATASLVIEPGDCGSKILKELHVTKDTAEALIGRTILVNGKLEKIDNPNKYIGKVVQLRSPMYCKRTNGHICGVCAGDNLLNYRKGVTILATDISSVLMKNSLKKMHTSVKKLVLANPIEMLQ